jgi:hypothetical protein
VHERRGFGKVDSDRRVRISPWAVPILLISISLLPLLGAEHAAAQALPWSRLSPGTSPAPRAAHDMAYDAQSDRIILFGGLDGVRVFGDTWAYDYGNDTWTPMNPAAAPSARSSHAMAYDAESDRVILFGGVDGIDSNETWAYDFNANAWSNMHPPTAPPARHGHRMAYDAQSDRIVILGGHRGQGSSATFLSDTWTYDFNSNTWFNPAPDPHPAGGNHGGLVYDEKSNRVIEFGGFEATGASMETWAYDVGANTWAQLRPSVAPSARFLVGMDYDAKADRVVLFGGDTGAAETWVYDYEANGWTEADPASAPSGRNGHRMSYDRQSDRTILFGGGTGLPGTVNNETWAFDLEALSPPPQFPWLLVVIPSIIGASAVAVVLFIRRRKRNAGEGNQP